MIAKEMFTQTADYTGSQSTEEVEVPHLIPLAQKWANSTKSEFRVKVTLTDGQQKNVKIKMIDIDETVSWLSKQSKDIDLVKIAGSKTGKTKDMELRKKEIVIDSDYYGYDKNSRYIQERKTALEAKFIQNADLKHKLINTKNAKLNKFKRRANPEVDELLMKTRQAMQ